MDSSIHVGTIRDYSKLQPASVEEHDRLLGLSFLFLLSMFMIACVSCMKDPDSVDLATLYSFHLVSKGRRRFSYALRSTT